MKTTTASIPIGLVLFALPLAAQGPITERSPEPRVETLTGELDCGTGGLVVDAQGFIYCADFGSSLNGGGRGGNKLFKIDPKTGEAVVFATGLYGASGNTIRRDGTIFQSNIGAGSISSISPAGEVTTYLPQGPKAPVGLMFDEEGLLFVASCGNDSVLEVTPDGEWSVLAHDPLLSIPNGIALDEEHNLYVSNFKNGDVVKVTPAGEVSRLATLPGGNNGHLTYHDGALYVVARGAHQIWRVTLDGKAEVFAGSGERGHADGPASTASFSYPNDLAFSPDGRTLYVNESGPVTGPHTVLAPTLVRAIRLQ